MSCQELASVFQIAPRSIHLRIESKRFTELRDGLGFLAFLRE
jgi:hypothetical protein